MMQALAPRLDETEAQPAHRYSLYGLTVHSDVPLPELPPAMGEASADLLILRRPLPEGPHGRFSPARVDLFWDTVGRFRVEPGLVTVDPAAGVSDDLVAFPLLGPVLALALHQRGLFAFHASAVSVNGRGAVMMADKGVGKSTTATALISAGHGLLADDIVALTGDSQPILLPGFAQVKLSDASLARLKVPGAQTRPQVHDAIDKHRVLLPAHVAAKAVPLGRIYALERGSAGQGPAVLPVQPAEALPLVLRFAYAARFGRDLLNGAAAARHFRQAATLAATGTVRRLVMPEGLDRLDAAVAMIEAGLASGGTE
ncbi:MAG: serine kinase [Cereibacter changlensis]